jgi:DNA-binding transcriptional LysR family regulator
MLDILRLRVLAAIAAHGSVTKAAKHLNYSQPAVSHHLARLEAETGARLVQRVGRGIRLTPEGEHLARRAAEIVGRVDTAAAELSAMVGLRTGRVRVAGFQSALAALVPHAAGTLRREHPGIDLHLIEAHPRVALDLLRAGQVDVAVVFRYDDTTPDDIRATHLFDDPMYLLSLEPGQTLAGNRDADWIAGCENCRREFLEACDKAGFVPPIAYTSDDIIVQQALVAAGMGVTTMPGLALRTHHAPGIEASVLRGPADPARRAGPTHSLSVPSGLTHQVQSTSGDHLSRHLRDLVGYRRDRFGDHDMACAGSGSVAVTSL